MRLLLIRHGETAHNASQLALGRADVPLNERGLLQARAVADGLKEPRHYEASRGAVTSETITAIYSSPLQRAVTTAEPLAEALGLPVQKEPGLIEMDIGEMDGLDFAQVRERYPDFLRVWLSDELADAAMPGGESLRQVQERAWAALVAIRDRHPEGTVVAVTHNFVLLTLLCQVLCLPISHFRHLRHDLAALSVFELNPKRDVIVSANDCCHLRDAGLVSGSLQRST